MLDTEAALARASAKAGLVPVEAAEAIAAQCRAERFDPAELGALSAAAGNPVVPLVRQLADRLPPGVADHVHAGATSQDVLDTAAMLVARRALRPLLDDLAGAADACAGLAAEHRGTLVAGRTLLQQAVPVTFGLKAAGWLVGLDETRRRLAEVDRDGLAVQLGGAAGTLAAFGDRGLVVLAELAAELDLSEPATPWHTVRTRPAALATALGSCAGVLAKVARDVALLAQTEVAEAREGGDPARGGSSAMPHKRNPVAAVAVAACAARVPGLVATVLGAMAQEHERAAGRLARRVGAPARPAAAGRLGRRLVAGAAGRPGGRPGADAGQPGRRRGAAHGRGGGGRPGRGGRPGPGPRAGRPGGPRRPPPPAARSGPRCWRRRRSRPPWARPGSTGALDPERYLGSAQALIDRALAAHRLARRRDGARPARSGAAREDGNHGLDGARMLAKRRTW